MTRSKLTTLGTLGSIALAACGGAQDTAATTPTGTESVEVSEPTPSGSELQRLNARAREGARTETLFGVEVADPFFALENDAPITTEWIEWQSARTRTALEGWTRPAMSERLGQVLRIGVISGASTYGPNVFFSRREGEREQPALYVRPLVPARGQTAEDRVLIDPLTLGERAALDWYFASPTGRYLAYGISNNGDERSTLHVLEVATGRVLEDAIEHCKWSDVSWLHAEDGFYYRRYPRAGEPDFDASQPDSYHARLFFHRLGSDPAADVLVYAPTDPTFFPSASVSDDDRYVAVNNSRGWSQGDVYLFDRGARAAQRVTAPDEAHPLVPVREGREQLYEARVHDGQLYLFTNEDAPRYRILRAPAAALLARGANASAPDPLTVLVPESDATLDGWAILQNRIALHELVDVRSRVRLVRMDGRAISEVTLPARGEVSSFQGDPETGNLVVGFSSFVNAPTLLTLGARATTLSAVTSVSSPIDLSQYEITTARVASRDGTQVPVTLVHRRGVTPDGNAHVLLYAYGGFNISLLPAFARHPLYWLERGGVYAVANLRGGGELGEEWHRAGNLGNKEHVFEDMEAVIRWLGGEGGWSSPSRIAITGGSNGGLLMGAMITRAPDAFRAAATYVGLYDMVRYHHFPPAEIWATEYGSADDEAQFRWLYAYSPYHRVRDGQVMPQVLVETADHDTRVYWGHSTKFAARLQEATGEADPSVWFFREQQVGHGAGTPVSVLIERYVRMYAFLEHALEVGAE
ncbi:MAG: S9 family peptidase [Deltaproteobacteria bacterium]|nr:S9 family peptidase [Deltaproteobacteria bacterium]